MSDGDWEAPGIAERIRHYRIQFYFLVALAFLGGFAAQWNLLIGLLIFAVAAWWTSVEVEDALTDAAWDQRCHEYDKEDDL